MYQQLVDFHLQYGHFIKPLIVGTLVSIVCSVIGCFIILRRLSFLSDAIAHAMLAGVVGGYLITKILFGSDAHLGAMLLGALLAGICTVGMIGLVTRVSRIKQDTAIGIMYTGIFALGAFAISMKYFGRLIHIDVYHFVVGSVLAVGNVELWLAGIVTAVVLSAVILFFRPLQLTSFDPVMAASIGVPVLAVDYLLTACTSLVVVSGVRIAGIILVVAMVITPAATAYLLFDRLHRMIVASAVIGVIGLWVGFALASLAGSSPGPAVVITSTAIFLLTLAVAPRYGLLANWFRLRQTVPQDLREDVLGAILRSPRQAMPLAEILKYVPGRRTVVRRAVGQLLQQKQLTRREHSFSLTPAGRLEARRVLRAHRLWETYLEQVGLPERQLHSRAHVLEHLNDEETVDYLDDKLGHPLVDPHGREIPEDFVHLQEQVLIKASLLREGHRAQIHQLGDVPAGLGLKRGMTFTVGQRSADGHYWTIHTPDGRQLSLDHQQADSLLVRLTDDDHPNAD